MTFFHGQKYITLKFQFGEKLKNKTNSNYLKKQVEIYKK